MQYIGNNGLDLTFGHSCKIAFSLVRALYLKWADFGHILKAPFPTGLPPLFASIPGSTGLFLVSVKSKHVCQPDDEKCDLF